MSNKISIKLSASDLHSIYYSIVNTEAANKSLPFKLTWKFGTIKDEIKTKAERYEKQRFEIYSKHGEVDSKDPNKIKLEAEKLKEVQAEIDDLGTIEEAIEIVLIPLSMFDAANVQLPQGAFEIFKKYIIDLES